MEFEQDLNAGNKRPNSEATEAVMANTMEVGQPAPRPTKKRASNPAEANQRHIKTEQARRDKIAAGFNALQELLPGRERVEKAMLLAQAANYLSQLQAVLHTILTNGSIAKLPDELQWQIRALLPRKEAAPRVPQAAVQSAQASQPPNLTLSAPQTADGSQQIDPQSVPSPGTVNLSFLPLMTQGANPGQQAIAIPQIGSKEMSKDESALIQQVQAQFQQIQQTAAAAQQLQSWTQALHALQLQTVFNQQQGGGQANAPDLSALTNFVSMAPPQIPVFKPSVEPASSPPSAQQATPSRSNPTETFTELLAPTQAQEAEEEEAPVEQEPAKALQQLAETAPEPDSSPKAGQNSGSKAKKNTAKGKKGASGAKPDSPIV